mgnify:CR=1 FL=1
MGAAVAVSHVDNTVSFTDRMPYATGLAGLYAGSAGCHPGGSVIGGAIVGGALGTGGGYVMSR